MIQKTYCLRKQHCPRQKLSADNVATIFGFRRHWYSLDHQLYVRLCAVPVDATSTCVVCIFTDQIRRAVELCTYATVRVVA